MAVAPEAFPPKPRQIRTKFRLIHGVHVAQLITENRIKIQLPILICDG